MKPLRNKKFFLNNLTQGSLKIFHGKISRPRSKKFLFYVVEFARDPKAKIKFLEKFLAPDGLPRNVQVVTSGRNVAGKHQRFRTHGLKFQIIFKNILSLDLTFTQEIYSKSSLLFKFLSFIEICLIWKSK